MEEKKPLIVIAGPTGVGKSRLGVLLAKDYGGEVISCDSMQVYRRMDIGTAKVTVDEMEGVPHHLIDVLDPKAPFDVVQFQKLAKEKIDEIHNRGRLPILVGGTGFYIQSILKDIDFTEEDADISYRSYLENLTKEKGADVLHNMLKEVDPASAESIHKNNIKRTIRALEFYKKTNTPISLHNESEKQKSSVYDSVFFVLTRNREALYQRIDERVLEMIEGGLVSEVQGLLDEGCLPEMTSMQGIGYKQLIPYLTGEIDLNSAISSIQQESRHYAKRQLTWFRRESDTIWIDRDTCPTEEELMEQVKSYIPEHFRRI